MDDLTQKAWKLFQLMLPLSLIVIIFVGLLGLCLAIALLISSGFDLGMCR